MSVREKEEMYATLVSLSAMLAIHDPEAPVRVPMAVRRGMDEAPSILAEIEGLLEPRPEGAQVH
jgi:hypothetical protein